RLILRPGRHHEHDGRDRNGTQQHGPHVAPLPPQASTLSIEVGAFGTRFKATTTREASEGSASLAICQAEMAPGVSPRLSRIAPSANQAVAKSGASLTVRHRISAAPARSP